MSARLFARQFQICYIVRDAERAMTRLRQRQGIARWHLLDLDPTWPIAMLALAYVDDQMIELIQPFPDRPSIYSGWEPESLDAMRLHHLGFLAKNDEEWRGSVDRLAANGYPVVGNGSVPDVLDYQYSDTTADFGHYYELVRLRRGGEALFASVPHN